MDATQQAVEDLTTLGRKGGVQGRLGRVSGWGLVLFAVLLAELTFFSLTNRSFFGGGLGMLSQVQLFLPTGLLALGLTMVILTGNMDLSVGGTASLASVIVGRALLQGMSIPLAILITIAIGALIGLVNGMLVAYLKLDSLLVTLATQFVVASFATALAGSAPPQYFAEWFLFLGRGSVASIPVSLIIFLSAGALIAVVIGRSEFGRRVILVGHNMSAGRYSGLPVARTLIGVFVGSGLMAGVGGVLLAAYYNTGRPTSGMSLLMPAITCVVLGGVDVFGGKGKVGDVIVAVLLLGFLTQGLLNSGLSSLDATLVTGLTLIVALVVKGTSEGGSIRGMVRQFKLRLGGGWRGEPSSSAKLPGAER